jgi:ATP-binding cassette subfamily F protein 3
MREVPIPSHITILFVEQEVQTNFTSMPSRDLELKNIQVVGDDMTALNSVLKADVWRDHLLAEEARLNARLAELDATPPGEVDARLEEARDEVSGRLAEVHTSLADMEAESGPARAAALLAGGF